MLLELAIGDAYGAGFEYADRDFVRAHNTLERFIKHPRHALVPGCYTDDTQMARAIAEAILADAPWTPEELASRFVAVFKRDPREGYAAGFYAFLTSVQSGAEFQARIKPTSDKSGAAMRAAPIGVCPTPQEVIARATLQAKLTHDTPDGISAACAAALMTHYFLYRHGPKADLGSFVDRHVPGDWSVPWQGKVKEKGWMSVRAAITALTVATSLSDLLYRCIAFTGDVDTVATIALAAGSCCAEIAQDLPENLIFQLEHGKYGHDYLVSLDRQLLALVR